MLVALKTMGKTAFITGVNGQDGSYLAELLLEKGYVVHGLLRRSSSPVHATWRLDHIGAGRDRLHLRYGDVTDGVSLRQQIAASQPDEVYNLAAQSDVGLSFGVAEQTANVTGLGALRVLDAIRLEAPQARFYQASSSEMFGLSEPPQNEATTFHPRSPYGCAKTFAHYSTVNYREAYGLFSVSGILFNHESPRRGENFVTRKITKAVAAIAAGQQDELHLGNLEAKRDWGFAGDYAEAMWLMLQQDEPDDFVIGTGEAHSVRDFCELAFAEVGLDWQNYVRHDQALERPADVDCLVADASKAHQALGWKPQLSFEQLVAEMVRSDQQLLRQQS